MALSQQTLDHLLEAESSLRAAVRSAATNEKPIVVTQLSQLLMDIERVREFEKLQDIVDAEIQKKRESVKTLSSSPFRHLQCLAVFQIL